MYIKKLLKKLENDNKNIRDNIYKALRHVKNGLSAARYERYEVTFSTVISAPPMSFRRERSDEESYLS